MNRRVVTNLVVFSLGFAVMVVWLASNVVSFKQVDKPFEVSADFANAFGVLPNAEVAYLGVKFGRVSSVDRRPGGVRVGMEIERGRKIPANAVASIFRKSAIGEQYVDFSVPAGSPSTGLLRQGDHLPQSRTTVPLEFSELLRSAAGLFQAIDPDDVLTVVGELSTGLRGRSESLRQLTTAGDELTASLASRTAALDRLAENGGRVTRTLAAHRGSLGSALTDLREISESLRNSKGNTDVLLTRGRDLLAQLGSLVADHKGELDCDLKVLELVIDRTTTPTKIAGLRTLLRFGPPAFAAVWDVRDVEADGVYARVGFVANAANPPRQYVPERTLPPVPAPAPCASPLRPSSISYTPGATGGLGDPVKTNAPSAAAVGALLAASAVVALRGTVRDAP
ncbi:MAG TPA: MCE family protein [Acidimicrobiales bacterium]|nr:MCE family protein [Acidimicrobiales bacterium]